MTEGEMENGFGERVVCPSVHYFSTTERDDRQRGFFHFQAAAEETDGIGSKMKTFVRRQRSFPKLVEGRAKLVVHTERGERERRALEPTAAVHSRRHLSRLPLQITGIGSVGRSVGQTRDKR